jgi:glycosyltransferase involved in cell wall biosynthesis
MNYSRSEIVLRQDPLKMGCVELALPRVSVIVTCFNYAKYIEDCLTSVAGQTYENFECVIVDDASTDDSALVIQRWIDERKDNRFRLISNSVNSGQTASFAAGLAATEGEFVAFLDADDFWFPDFLLRHVEAHLNRSFSASVSCSDLVQVDEWRRGISGTWVGPVFEAMFEDRKRDAHRAIESDHSASIVPATGLTFYEIGAIRYVYPSYLEYPWTATSAMMFRRSVLDLLMPKDPTALKVCTDCYVFVMSHFFTGSLLIDNALGAYRRHGTNSFASNRVVGSGLPCAPATITKHQRTIVGLMLGHLLENYDRLSSFFPGADVRRLIRILFAKTLREDIAVGEANVRKVLGARRMMEARARAMLLRLPFGWARRSGLR